jgi:hypothetical protein
VRSKPPTHAASTLCSVLRLADAVHNGMCGRTGHVRCRRDPGGAFRFCCVMKVSWPMLSDCVYLNNCKFNTSTLQRWGRGIPSLSRCFERNLRTSLGIMQDNRFPTVSSRSNTITCQFLLQRLLQTTAPRKLSPLDHAPRLQAQASRSPNDTAGSERRERIEKSEEPRAKPHRRPSERPCGTPHTHQLAAASNLEGLASNLEAFSRRRIVVPGHRS